MRQTSLEAGGAGEFFSLTNVLKMRADGPLSGVELGPLLGRGSYGRVYKVRRCLPVGLRYHLGGSRVLRHWRRGAQLCDRLRYRLGGSGVLRHWRRGAQLCDRLRSASPGWVAIIWVSVGLVL